MRCTILVLLAAAATAAHAQQAAPIGAPQYAASGLVNSADLVTGAVAPNTIVTLQGENLSFSTSSLQSYEIQNATLPNELPFTGVHVYIGGLMANMYYVSPTQISFLIPIDLLPGATTFQVVRDGYAGPQLPLTLLPVAPAFFMMDSERILAQHLDGSMVTTGNPAQPGETVVLYATGLGQTVPPLFSGEVPQSYLPIANVSELRILLNGAAVPAANIVSACAAPTYSGVYAIQLRLPSDIGPDPQIRMAIDSQMSLANTRLIVMPPL